MDYEKKYKEALERAKQFSETPYLEDSKGIVEYIFPEIAESEDERIRIWIREELESKYVVDNIVNNVMADKALAWLEKQGEHKKFRDSIQVGDKVTRNEDGVLVNLSQLNWIAKKDEKQVEQKDILEDTVLDSNKDGLVADTIRCKTEKQGEKKPVDKVEPKFHEGDWIINSLGTLRHIINVDKGGYQTDGGWLTHDTYEKTFHLWTIQDAKDGDVLVSSRYELNDWICIFKSLEGENDMTVYCFLSRDKRLVCDPVICNGKSTDCTPATKEQRDLLFQKMHEAGYEWDAEKKELKKIEQKPAEWSKEDEEMVQVAINACNSYQDSLVRNDSRFDKAVKAEEWLKSLRPNHLEAE